MPSDGPPPGTRYDDVRPYAVANSLDELQGPTSGVVVLDRWLDWSGSARYDLTNPGRLARMYETVLREASRTADLSRWLEGRTLARLWGDLVLPPQVRAHGILQRPSEDVDLFADWDRRADFPAAVDAVIVAYRADGLEIATELRTELIARRIRVSIAAISPPCSGRSPGSTMPTTSPPKE
ncbi:hypothetical protein [Frankia sp. AgPm24]|uniref:hypothetical protein n=1 Tax=Frankia sp. AgPm24 TaxID=631128 RepID=UPI00200BA882|nr:hypothetical protein [Frankia sp. AgPm24]